LNPPAGVAAWQPPARPRLARQILKAATVAVIVLVVSQYLAAFLFLWSAKGDVSSAMPLTVMRYAYYFGDLVPVRRRLVVCLAAGTALTLVGGLAAFLPRRRPLHGAARFARRAEIAAAGLLGDDGIILGRLRGLNLFRRRYLMLGGQQGVSLAAQPRAGKGVGVVVPNLLHWTGSVVCVDIKKENWILTAGFRTRQGQEAYLFDPLSPDGRTARWNPLDYVSESPNQQISDLQLIANMFFPDPVASDPFWMSSGRSLFLGIALYLFSTPNTARTIGEILRQGMANDEEGFAQHWKRVIKGRMSGRNPLPEQCVRALYDVIDLAPQTTSSIRKTFTSRLELWMNPVLDAATAASDFDLRALRSRPISIYLGVTPKNLERLAPLMSLFFQQAIALQTDQLPEHNPTVLRYQVLMLLDEFPALGPIPIIAKASGFLPGYNVRTLMIMQTPAQLRQVYGQDGAHTLLKTLAARIFFAPKDMDDAEEVSKELGFTTAKARSYSKPLFDFSDFKNRRHRSVNISEQRRPLMLPQEARDMGLSREIIFVENLRPIMAAKIRYYTVSEFRRRLFPAPIVRPIGPASLTLDPPPSPDSAGGSIPGKTERVLDNTLLEERTREAKVEDVERVDDLTAEDFAVDLSRVQIPEKAEGQRLTEEELHVAVESFLDTLRG
jgi:type IV secretion system protein VirD4